MGTAQVNGASGNGGAFIYINVTLLTLLGMYQRTHRAIGHINNHRSSTSLVIYYLYFLLGSVTSNGNGGGCNNGGGGSGGGIIIKANIFSGSGSVLSNGGTGKLDSSLNSSSLFVVL